MAMLQAGKNFNHKIQTSKQRDHELVTSGVYAYVRHPSYLGFWCWGLGTQVVAGNSICLAGYAVVLWRFFSDRIERELSFLSRFPPPPVDPLFIRFLGGERGTNEGVCVRNRGGRITSGVLRGGICAI